MLDLPATTLGAIDAVAGVDTAVVSRIMGRGHREHCPHLPGPGIVLLHSALGVHLCESCASSTTTRAHIDRYRPIFCDSCGQREDGFFVREFTGNGIIVTAFVCRDCHHGRRAPLLPD